MNNFSKCNVGQEARVELHDKLFLTGAEVSFNHLPAGTSVPFVHSHQHNEEIYLVLEGEGKAILDGETILLSKGDCLRVSPKTKRQFFASETNSIRYICIQVKENSLNEFTMTDAVVEV